MKKKEKRIEKPSQHNKESFTNLINLAMKEVKIDHKKLHKAHKKAGLLGLGSCEICNPQPKREWLEDRFMDCSEYRTNSAKFKACRWYNDVLYDLRERYSKDLTKARQEGIREAVRNLPKEKGFDDYGKHIHAYIFENKGKCRICGLSWKKAGEYEIYNSAIKEVRNKLKVL